MSSVLVLLLLLSQAGSSPAWRNLEDLPERIASVNGEAIRREQFWSIYQSYQRANPAGTVSPELGRLIVDRLVDATLLHQEALRSGIQIRDAQVDVKLEELRSQFADEDSFRKAVAIGGFDEGRLRADLRKDLAIAELVQRRIEGAIGASEEELKDWYESRRGQLQAPEEVRVSQILIPVAPDADIELKQRARTQIEECQALVQASGNFAEVARRRSQDPASAGTGGDLGWFSRPPTGGRRLPAELEQVAFGLSAGQLSPIVVSPEGYHLVLVSERRPSRTFTFDEVRGQIRATLLEQKRQQRLAELIQQLRGRAQIETFLR
jgi:parvulin-like peptidyl-prolyl isomerase